MTTITDDFNRANENPIAGNWQTVCNGGIQLNTNAVKGTGAGKARISSYKSASTTLTANHSAEITITTANSFDDIGVAVRCSTAASGSCYAAYANKGDGRINIYKVVAGVATEMTGSPIGSITWANGDAIKLSATTNGSNVDVKVYQNGVQKGSTITDTTSVLTGIEPGLGYDVGDSNLTIGDSFVAIDDAVGGGSSSKPNFLLLGIG